MFSRVKRLLPLLVFGPIATAFAQSSHAGNVLVYSYVSAVGASGDQVFFEPYDLTLPADSFNGQRPKLESPANTTSLGNLLELSSWASAAVGVLKVRSVIETNPVYVTDGREALSAYSYAVAGWEDSLTWSGGQSRNMRLRIDYRPDYLIAAPTPLDEQTSWTAGDGSTIASRSVHETYQTELSFSVSSEFVDRNLEETPALNDTYAAGNTFVNGWPLTDDRLISVYVPFVEGLPFSYRIYLRALVGLNRGIGGQNMSEAPELIIPGTAVAVYADRSLYFASATILDDLGNEYSVENLHSSLGLNYAQPTLVPEPGSFLLLLSGLLLLAGVPRQWSARALSSVVPRDVDRTDQ